MLTIRGLRRFDGASPECSQPALRAVVDVADRPDDAQAVVDQLASIAQAQFGIAVQAATGADERALIEAVARLSTLLMRKQGVPALCEPAVEALGAHAWLLVLPTLPGVHAATSNLLRGWVDLVNAIANHADAAASVESVRRSLQAFAPHAAQGKNTLQMLEAAHRMGIPWQRVVGNVYRLGTGSRQRWFDSALTDRTSSLGVQLARDKHTTATLLRANGFPVPVHTLVKNESDVLAAASRFGYPLVVKPANLDRGIGVATMLRNEAQLLKAYANAARHSKKILVEKHFEGVDYRINVWREGVFRIRERVPGGVRGDGRSTVAELLAALNADPRRGPYGTPSILTRMDLDEEALELLEDQGLDPRAVPQADRFVRLRRIANVSAGGTPVHFETADAHPDNLRLAIRAVAALKLDLGGVDLLIPDLRRSWMETGAVICEVNARPQWSAGASEELYEQVFPHGSRVPVVMVIGDPPPVWLKAAVRDSGSTRVGLYDGTHVWIGAQRISPRPAGGAYQAGVMLLGDEAVDAAVIVLDDTIQDEGSPVDRIDAIVLCGEPSPAAIRTAKILAPLAARLWFDGASEGWRGQRGRLRCVEQREADAGELASMMQSLLTSSR